MGAVERACWEGEALVGELGREGEARVDELEPAAVAAAAVGAAVDAAVGAVEGAALAAAGGAAAGGAGAGADSAATPAGSPMHRVLSSEGWLPWAQPQAPLLQTIPATQSEGPEHGSPRPGNTSVANCEDENYATAPTCNAC